MKYASDTFKGTHKDASVELFGFDLQGVCYAMILRRLGGGQSKFLRICSRDQSANEREKERSILFMVTGTCITGLRHHLTSILHLQGVLRYLFNI